jgi:hypothetical protein
VHKVQVAYIIRYGYQKVKNACKYARKNGFREESKQIYLKAVEQK